MNSITKKVLTAAAVTIAAIGFAAPAFAAAAAGSDSGTGTGTGTGTVAAVGSGTAVIVGDVDSMVVTGVGTLVVTDHGGDAVVHVAGHGVKRTVGNVTTYTGYNGRATITGSDVTVKLAGVDVHLLVHGDGSFTLRGHGAYDTQPGVAGGEGVWTNPGATGLI